MEERAMTKGKISRSGLVIIAIIIAMLASLYAIQSAQPKKSDNGINYLMPMAHNGRVLIGAVMVDTAFEPPPKSGDVLDIREKMFVAQINDIYLNLDDYLGRAIRFQGIFKREYIVSEYGDVEAEPFYYVIRYGPGCCGYDANVGFEVSWPKGSVKPYPDDNAWVEAVGTLTADKKDSMLYLYLKLRSLTVMATRGKETVLQ